jgi:type IV secretory pathway TrbF-like protein
MRTNILRIPSARIPESPKTGTIEDRVRHNSRAVWNVWVGTWQYREKVAIGVAALFGAIALLEGAALVKEAGKPSIPPAIITVDGFGQVRDVARPVLAPMTDTPTKHFLGQFVQDVFEISTSADVLADQYSRARYFLVPGSTAFLDVQRYWDRYSPLRKMADGTLQIVNPPKQTLRLHVTSFLSQGKSADGGEVWELQWTSTPRDHEGNDLSPTLYRGRLAFKRGMLPDNSDDATYANPFGILIESFTWDQVQ